MNNFINKFFALICISVVFSSLAQAASTSQIVLVQNSGWMLPFYDDPKSNFKEVVVELTNRISTYEDNQIILSFNQTYEKNESPYLFYKGNDKEKIKSAIASIEVAKKPGKGKYADTDFKEAIIGAITKHSLGKSALLWVVTNNKNSPSNSADTVEKNKEFYRFLQSSKDIKRIVAFPFPLSVQSKSYPSYKADGLMFYAIAYGDAAEKLLIKMLNDNAPFGKQPARLKPQNSEAITFIPKAVENKKVDVRLGSDKKTLYMSFNADGKPESTVLYGNFRNDFFPYDIQSGNLEIEPVGFKNIKQGKIKFEALDSSQLSNILAGNLSKDVKVKISIPPIPSVWRPDVLFGNGYKTIGAIRFKLSEQKLIVSESFINSMDQLFPNDPLPELFLPNQSSRNSITEQRVVIQVNYPVWPLIAIVLLFILLIIIIIYLISKISSDSKFRISVDGYQKHYQIKAFSKVAVTSQNGDKVGEMVRKIGKPIYIPQKGKNNIVRIL